MQHKDSITTSDDGSVMTVRLTGEVDATLRREAARALAAVRSSKLPVVVDLSAVSFIDSTGVGLLLQCHKACLGRGMACTLRGTPPRVERVLTVLGLLDVLHLGKRATTAS
ncbi:STAS domain-containing protein [Cellulomonas sp. ES6]|uniref:STAS domain-containing protein n=1 Tax=Cellulomonas sp. ES6 TaxID=3039384 RepID=UPI0024B6C803|nr:STAS domain-containing protein [Cellulomonas sp. ES6]WHP18853.1 STAS domain-containing protein [Cellulomonas sp. ES6]